MRRGSLILMVMLVAVVALLGTSPRGSEAAQPFAFSLAPVTLHADPGATVTVDVHISDVSDMSAFGFTLGYDPSVATVEGVTKGPLIESGGLQSIICLGPEISEQKNSAKYGCASLGGTPVSGSGLAATVTFKAQAQGTVQLTFITATVTNALGDPQCGYVDASRSGLQNCTWVGATLQVGTPPSGSDSGPTPTPPSSSNGAVRSSTATPVPTAGGATSTPQAQRVTDQRSGQTVTAVDGRSQTATAGPVTGTSPNAGQSTGAETPAVGQVAGAQVAGEGATHAGHFGYGPQDNARGTGRTWMSAGLLLVVGLGMVGGGAMVERNKARASRER